MVKLLYIVPEQQVVVILRPRSSNFDLTDPLEHNQTAPGADCAERQIRRSVRYTQGREVRFLVGGQFALRHTAVLLLCSCVHESGFRGDLEACIRRMG